MVRTCNFSEKDPSRENQWKSGCEATQVSKITFLQQQFFEGTVRPYQRRTSIDWYFCHS